MKPVKAWAVIAPDGTIPTIGGDRLAIGQTRKAAAAWKVVTGDRVVRVVVSEARKAVAREQ